MVARPPRQSAQILQQRSAHLLDIIADMTGLGTWELEVGAMTPLWSSHARRIFGRDAGAALHLEDIFDHYAPEARPIIATAFQ